MNHQKTAINKPKAKKGVPIRDDQTSTASLEYPPAVDGVSFCDDIAGLQVIQVPEEFDKSFAATFEQEALGDDEEFVNAILDQSEEPLKIINGLEGAEVDQEILDNLYQFEDAGHLHQDIYRPINAPCKEQPKKLPELNLSTFNQEQLKMIKQFVAQFNEMSLKNSKSATPPLRLAVESKSTDDPVTYLITKPGNYPKQPPKPIIKKAPTKVIKPQDPKTTGNNSIAYRQQIIADLTKGFTWVHRIRPSNIKVISIKTPGFTPEDIEEVILKKEGLTNGKDYMYYVLTSQGKMKILKSQYLLKP